MARSTVRLDDMTNIDLIRSQIHTDEVTFVAFQCTEKYQHASTSTEERYCWICLQNDSENPAAWVHPCKCKGSTKWVHLECLSRWIDEKQKNNVLKSIACQQCRTEYKMILSSMGPIANLLEKYSLYLDRSYPCWFAGFTFGGLYWCSITFGIVTVLQIFGHTKGLFLLKSTNPVFLFFFLPTIPLVLIIGRVIRWENCLIRILYGSRFYRSIPLLNILIADSDEDYENENSSRPPALALVESLCPSRAVFGALCLPTVACFVGHILYRSIKNCFYRAMLGGVTVVTVKGLLKIFLSREKFRRNKTKIILDYTPENMRKFGISTANNTGLPEAVIQDPEV